MSDLLPDAVLRYAAHEDGLIDVHLPRSGHRGDVVVLLLHGGFWKTAYDRRHTRPMARALAESGLVVATPEYRRVGPGGTGGWPLTAEDVRRSAGALPGLLDGIGVDAGRLRSVGHSAGGHLALWLASTGLQIERTVALAPVCDLRAALERRLGDDAVRAFLGPDLDETLPQADPMSLLDVRPNGTVQVLHGTEDEVVPVELSRGLVRRHPWVTLTELPVGHFELIEPVEAAFAEVRTALTDAQPR